MKNNGRHELKFYINLSDYMQLKSRLKHIAKPDQNILDGGKYKINSLYFDNYSDKAVVEKLQGLGTREKFRLRYYNRNISFIRLEKKSKANQLCYKESAMISKVHCNEIISGNYSSLKCADSPLLMELYTKTQYQLLRPRNIVEYTREAYTFNAGNVRITFDSNIKASYNISAFLNAKLVTIPTSNSIILEVKYDGFLPQIIGDILQIGCRNQTEFSKYIVSRLL